MGTYVSAWGAIQDHESFAEVLSTSKFIVLDMTTLIPAGTGQELGERITYLMQPSIECSSEDASRTEYRCHRE